MRQSKWIKQLLDQAKNGIRKLENRDGKFNIVKQRKKNIEKAKRPKRWDQMIRLHLICVEEIIDKEYREDVEEVILKQQY